MLFRSDVLDKAGQLQQFEQKQPILFIDEIHRFSKSQQDSLLGAVERGLVTLIGATTENPSFEVISALLSRCQVYVLEHLSAEELRSIIDHALETDPYLDSKRLVIEEYDALLRLSGGDARRLLNVFELVAQAGEMVWKSQTEAEDAPDGPFRITNDFVLQQVQQQMARYDKTGEQHYDIISAFIKSIRGSDPNAAVYWLARMIEGGEDPSFIARRLLISAAEDVGLANPNALLLATNAFQAIQMVGWPESRIILSEVTIYLATSAKSNSAYKAINEAQALVRQSGNLPVPLHLRNAPTKLMKELSYGATYKYSHDYPHNFAEQEFLPEKLSKTRLWTPQDNAQEAKLRERMEFLWKRKYK